MANGSSIAYRLRPNKSVDRELFLSLLVRLSPNLSLQNYRYVGLGGPFLEDFRLIHSRLAIDKMTCIETNEETHKRQIFNRPIPSIDCVHNSLEAYLEEEELDEPSIIWFDYTEPKALPKQISTFSSAIGAVPVGSILRITLNANPASLGTPDTRDLAVKNTGVADTSESAKPDISEWRLARLKERLGPLFPAALKPEGMTFKNYGRSLLEALRISVDNESLNHFDRKVVWALATHYADGQPMATAAIVIVDPEDSVVEELIGEWEYFSTPEAPLKVDLPSLSTLERLTMEAKIDPALEMGFELPRSELGENPLECFKRFYRVFPHFSRVEL